MLITLNDRLFLAINAPAHPNALTLAIAGGAASWLVYVVAALMPALWIWGRHDKRGALLATVLGVSAALGLNQVLGLLWYEPRPFMIGLGHTLAFHAVENSFPSDHATFMWSLGFALIATGAARRWGAVVGLAGGTGCLGARLSRLAFPHRHGGLTPRGDCRWWGCLGCTAGQ